MTLKELQDELGNQINIVKVLSPDDKETAKFTIEKSDMISRLAKQMINNADVILRTDKLIAEGKLESISTIASMVGGRE